MPSHVLSATAGGDIRTNRFVSIGAANHVLIESNSGDKDVVGISQVGSQEAPIPQNSSVLAASDGYQFQYRSFGSEALLEVGTGGATRGVYMKPDNDGKGVSITSDDYGFFLPFESAIEGELVRGLITGPVYTKA